MLVFNIVFHMVIKSLHLKLHLGYTLAIRSSMEGMES